MATHQPTGFADNWSYLKTELNWLDRVLMVAVARQRQDTRQLDRVIQSRADRISSHWWKGVVSLEGTASYDEHRTSSGSARTKGNYQQQLDARIQISHTNGVVLALPALRDRLNLSIVEKNIILMSLAPEVNRRYARIYRYLQGEDATQTDLPTVDLVLRLLCRNDSEWRKARRYLIADSVLVQRNLLTLLPASPDTMLNADIKSSKFLVNYLLADKPTPADLEALLNQSSTLPQWIAPQNPVGEHIRGAQPNPRLLDVPPIIQPPVANHLIRSGTALSWLSVDEATSVKWSDVIVPADLKTTLRAICQRTQAQPIVDQEWGFANDGANAPQIGAFAILVGSSGTGKTTAARAIAHTLQHPLHWLDLAHVDVDNTSSVLRELTTQQPDVLLIKSAELWLKRSASLPIASLNQFLTQRHRLGRLTLFSVRMIEAVSLHWRRQARWTLNFPVPDASARLMLWKHAFPPEAPISQDIDWKALAQNYSLTGGTIRAIALEAALAAATDQAPQITMDYIRQALTSITVNPKRRSRR
ncbi:MAG: AAA family ATPase [Elainellaceae cyanobacterium]